MYSVDNQAAQAAVAELDSKNKHDWKVIVSEGAECADRRRRHLARSEIDSASHPVLVRSEPKLLIAAVTPASGGDTSESIQLPFPLESGDKDGYSQCTVILMPEDEGSSHLLKLRYRSRWFTRDRRE